MELNFLYKGKLIKITSATDKEASLLLYWWNDGEIMAHAGFPLGLNTSLEKVKQNILKNNETRQLLIIYCDNLPIGEMNFEIKNNIAQFGIKICNKDFQNNGYGVAVLNELFKYLFETKNVDKIECDTNLKNIRSQYVYEKKLNMKRIKTFYNSFINQIGEKCSVTVFEITKNDYMSYKTTTEPANK